MILPSLADQLAETLTDELLREIWDGFVDEGAFRQDEFLASDFRDRIIAAQLPLLTQREAAIREEAMNDGPKDINGKLMLNKYGRQCWFEGAKSAEADLSRLRAVLRQLVEVSKPLLTDADAQASHPTVKEAEAVLDHLASLETPAKETP